MNTKFAIAVLRGTEHQLQVYETAEELDRAWDAAAGSLPKGAKIAAGYLKVQRSGDMEFLIYKRLESRKEQI
jgi:hypothetical protein